MMIATVSVESVSIASFLNTISLQWNHMSINEAPSPGVNTVFDSVEVRLLACKLIICVRATGIPNKFSLDAS